MPGRVTTELTQIGKAFAIVFRNILELKFLFITMMIVGHVYFIANYRTINLDWEIVVSYSIIAYGVLILAIIWKVDLRKLTWRPAKPLDRKYLKSPKSLPGIIVIGVLSAIFTLYFMEIFSPFRAPAIEGYAALDIAYQQIFLVALTETVIFQGTMPLLIQEMFTRVENKAKEKKKKELEQVYHQEVHLESIEVDEIKYAWLVSVTISQTGFALVHWVAYGGDLMDMLVVGLLGTVWFFMARYLGIVSAWFSHGAYNLRQLGVIGGAAAQAISAAHIFGC